MKMKNSTLGGFVLLFLGILAISAFVMNNSTKEKRYAEKEAMIADWQWAKAYTLSYIEVMPESSINFRPTDSTRTFAEQMLHITSANVGFTAQATGLPPIIEDVRGLEKNDAYKTKAALALVVAEGYDYVIASLQATPDQKLGEGISLFGQYEMTRGEAINKAFIHQNHHRGQTAVYIRLAGGVPAPMKLL